MVCLSVSAGIPGLELPETFVRARTAGSLISFPATSFLGTVLQALRKLMYRGKNLSVPGLRATSQNILMSMMKVNEACAWPPHVM
jgi:hypothetical protein